MVYLLVDYEKLVIRAQIEGIESIRISSTNKKYSRETKIAAVQEYIYLKSSLSEVCKKYHICQLFHRFNLRIHAAVCNVLCTGGCEYEVFVFRIT